MIIKVKENSCCFFPLSMRCLLILYCFLVAISVPVDGSDGRDVGGVAIALTTLVGCGVVVYVLLSYVGCILLYTTDTHTHTPK